MTVAQKIRQELRARADRQKAKVLKSFFRTGPGEYGEGDRFLGVMVPDSRRIALAHQDAGLDAVAELLASPVHEERLVALLILVRRYERGGSQERAETCRFYLRHLSAVNNWDLVDLTAPKIVGSRLLDRPRRPLYRLARSRHLWSRRVAIIATFAFIRRREFADTFAIADLLAADRHDLIHKAIGWMLREVGKRSVPELERYLKPRYAKMPRTTLRYAIEKFPERRRRSYLKGSV